MQTGALGLNTIFSASCSKILQKNMIRFSGNKGNCQENATACLPPALNIYKPSIPQYPSNVAFPHLQKTILHNYPCLQFTNLAYSHYI